MRSWEFRGQPAFEELPLVFNEAFSFCLMVTSTFEHCVLKQVLLIFKLVTSNFFRGNCCFLFNPLTPVSDQDRISPYNINTISNRQVMRIKKNIS